MKVVFIIPYFGKFPDYFNLFLKTCENNPNYEWLIISDINCLHDFPTNVQQVKMSFEELKHMFQKKIDFPIALSSPYKLCDYRPAYGFLFQDFIKECDYWGYSDVDLLFGDLNQFIPHEKIKDYDKIGHLGHLSLYRNDAEINKMFTAQIDGICRYKEVFQTNNSCIFDEWDWISINHIFLKNQKKVWMFDEFFDVYPYDDNFKRTVRKIPSYKESYGKDIIEKNTCFASLEDGKTYQWSYQNGVWSKNEVAYVHFQKRDMQVMVKESEDNVFCVPDKFVSLDGKNIPKEYLKSARCHMLFNKKRINWEAKKISYKLIEKTSLIRHPFRNYKK